MDLIALLGKGGTAKTTSTASLGHAFARRGLRTVIIDLDSQASLSDWLVGERDEELMVEQVLLGKRSWSEVLVEVAPNLRLAPTMNFALKEVDLFIDTIQRQRELHVAKHLAQVPDADVVLMDTPRGLDTNIALNVFEAMTGALVVSEPAPMSVTAQREIIGAVREFEEVRDVPLLLGVLPTRYDSRTSMARITLEAMNNSDDYRVFTRIRLATRASEIVAVDELLWDYAPEATATQDYETAADEILGALKEAKAA